MSNDSHEIWRALDELGDYFSRLGGSARPLGMRESEIPLYVACVLAKRCFPSFESSTFISPQFLEAAAPVLEKTNSHIGAVTASGESLLNLIFELVSYADSKLKPQEKTAQWSRFGEQVKVARAQQTLRAEAAAQGGLS